MVESLIENVHRANLKPMEQAKAILEVFKAEGNVTSKDTTCDGLPQKINQIKAKLLGHYTNCELTEEEQILHNIVKKIGLSVSVVYKSLKILSLSESVQVEATEKGVGKLQLVSISAVEDEHDQKAVLDIVVEEELSQKDTAALTKAVKSAPEPVKRAVLDATVPVDVAQTIIDTKRTDAEQEAMVKIVMDKKLSKEGTEQLAAVVESAPEPVKRAVLDTDLDMDTAEEITVAFEDLPDDATEQVTEEVVEMVSKGRTDEYITKHIETRQWEAERMADPEFKEPVHYDLNAYERFANGIIKQCKVVQNLFIGRVIDMPKAPRDRSIAAVLAAHKYLERHIQFLYHKGLLTTDVIEAHRADCALQLPDSSQIADHPEGSV